MTGPNCLGLRVIELAEGVSGPYCGRILAGFGADVLKVEAPGRGDVSRSMGPFKDDVPGPERSGLFAYLNANKRSVCLDTGDPTDLYTLRSLAADSDLMIMSGLDGPFQHEQLAAENPRLVTVNVSAFGESGPYRDFLDSELTLQALGGIAGRTGRADREPLPAGALLSQFIAGSNAISVALAAVYKARSRGSGCHIDLSTFEAVVQFLQGTMMKWSFEKQVVKRGAQSRAASSIYPCADGFVGIFSPGSGTAWRNAAAVMDEPLLADERFKTRAQRSQFPDELDALILPWTLSHTKEEIYHRAQAAGLPFGPVRTPEEFLESPHHRERQFIRTTHHPVLGPYESPGMPFRVSSLSWRDGPAPLLGQDTSPIPGAGRPRSTNPSPASATVGTRADGPADFFSGVRILDLTASLAGPWCTRFLADLGCEVIKIESCEHYDLTRGPSHSEDWRAYARRGTAKPYECTDTFLKPNRGKLGITLDLKRAMGVAVFKRLLAMSDVVVENFAPGQMDRFGLSFEAMREINPRIIYATMPSLGNSGPERDYVGYGNTVECLSGIASLTGYEDGVPMNSEMWFGDPAAGLHGAAAVATALLHRETTGEGSLVEIPQVEGLACWLGDAFLATSMNGETPKPSGAKGRWGAPPSGAVPCRGEDEWVAIAVTTVEQRSNLEALLGRRDASDDALHASVCSWSRELDKHEAMALLQAAGVPAGAVHYNRDLFDDPHLLARGFFESVSHPFAGTHLYPGASWLVDGRRPRSASAAPMLGQHNRLVLNGLLGLTEEEVDRLAVSGVIGNEPTSDRWGG